MYSVVQLGQCKNEKKAQALPELTSRFRDFFTRQGLVYMSTCLSVVCGLWSIVCGLWFVLDNFEPSDWSTRLSLVIRRPVIGRRSSECFGSYAGVCPR